MNNSRYNTIRTVIILALHFSLQNFISAQDITYNPLFTSGSFSKTINVNLAVGVTPATANVVGGSASYNIPIAIPPGTNGVQPSVSLVYNSLSGNGILGQGWSITGYSSIMRIGQTIYHDGAIKAVTLTSEDRFSLDNSRLFLKSGTYGTNGATYGPEIENFSTVTSNGNLGGGPLWFSVETKDGVILEYGNTADSRFLSNDNSKVVYWNLNRVRYKDGNYMEYKYVLLNNQMLLDAIEYTGNSTAGLLPYNKIKFNYKLRLDKTTGYEANNPIKSVYLLHQIVVTAENAQAVKTYNLKYGNNNITSFLTEVQELGSTGAALNSTIFRYGDQPAEFIREVSTINEGNNYVDIISGDFDGDGYSEIMTAFFSNFLYNTYETKVHTGFKIYRRTANNPTYQLAYSETFPTNEQYQFIFGQRVEKASQFNTYDYDGDGRDDLMLNRIAPSGYSNDFLKVVHFKRYTSTSTVGGAITFIANSYPTYNNTTDCMGVCEMFKPENGDGQFFFSGDFDGDGAMDYITILANTLGYKATISLPAKAIFNDEITNILPSWTCVLDGIWKESDYHNIVDFNGDGKDDLMLTKGSETSVFTFSASGSDWIATSIYYAGYPTKWHMIYTGDFNGDKKTDLLTRSSTIDKNAPWNKAISTGTGFVETPFTFNHIPNITESSSDDKLVLADLNADNKTDIYQGWDYLVSSFNYDIKHDVYYSRGNDFYYVQHNSDGYFSDTPLSSADMNGDGRPELINAVQNTAPFDVYHFRKEGQENLLQGVKNGFDHDVQFAYKRLTQTAEFYTRGPLINPPVLNTINNIQIPIYFVSEYKTENGLGGFSTSTYSYEELRLHREGKGILGFKKQFMNDLTMGKRMVEESEFNTTYFIALPYKVSTLLLSDYSLISEKTLTNQCLQQGGANSKRVWVRSNSIYENDDFQNRYVNTAHT